MEIKHPTYQEVIEALKVQLYSPEDAANLSISEEGRKVEFEGEIWYEMTVADSTSYTSWGTILDGEFTNYDGHMLSPEDRIPELDALIAEDFEE